MTEEQTFLVAYLVLGVFVLFLFWYTVETPNKKSRRIHTICCFCYENARKARSQRTNIMQVELNYNRSLVISPNLNVRMLRSHPLSKIINQTITINIKPQPL